MTSKIKVDNINKVSDDSNIIKKCGTTTTIGSGASNPIVVDGSAVTLGRCGGTVALASGATQTGFGRTGTVDWQTGSIKTATFTAANGEGYFADTSSGAITMNLPAGTAGSIVSVVDYTNTFQTNGLTITPNGSQKLGGTNASAILSTEGQSVTFVYVDDTEGWKNVQDSTSAVVGFQGVTATGGTITTSGDCKIHTFTGPGTFCVSAIAAIAANNQVSYMVVAGGGAGGDAGARGAGGGGAGGFREDKSPVTPYTASPLDGAGNITVTAAAFPITVGAGGAVRTNPNVGNSGSNSIFSTITSAGGGGGGGEASTPSDKNGVSGGSGGGGGRGGCTGSGGSGNTPPVSPAQGNNGGSGGGPGSTSCAAGGGGGGATAAGGGGSGGNAGSGGAGATTNINGSPTTFGGGGGGSTGPAPSTGNGAGGAGGGANGGGYPGPAANAGTANTGGGGGGASDNGGGGAGGSGIVIIRYKFQ